MPNDFEKMALKKAMAKTMDSDADKAEDSMEEYCCPKCGYMGTKEDFMYEENMAPRKKPKNTPAPPSDDEDEY